MTRDPLSCLQNCSWLRLVSRWWRNADYLASIGLIAALLLSSGLKPALAGAAKATTSNICRAAAHQVAGESGVPLDVLLAITLTETGRSRSGGTQPWPWTVNMEGKGVWFDNRAEAEAYARAHYGKGARSFDIGCFQINYRWHGEAFSSIEQMFDPLANARYAAHFLTELYAEFGNWGRAAGAYHSRTPEFASRYRARFDRFRRDVANDPQPVDVAAVLSQPEVSPVRDYTTMDRENLFPLLRATGRPRGAGSLVPLARSPVSGQRLIGGSTRG